MSPAERVVASCRSPLGPGSREAARAARKVSHGQSSTAMPPVTVHPLPIKGPWTEGYVLDFHTISSIPTGDPYNPFDTKRTELGDLVYRLKYRNDPSVLSTIADTAEDFIRSRWQPAPTFEAIVPVPPSLSTRKNQSVVELARELASRLEVGAWEDAVRKAIPTPQMKNVPIWERQELLKDAIQRGSLKVMGKRILLLDDLIESGSTLRRATDVLWSSGPSQVYALVMTRTR